MIASSSDLSGLTEEQVIFSREQFGTNNTSKAGGNKLLDTIQSLLQEPMLFLLLIASFIHLLSWQLADAVFLMIAILLVSAISLYQTARSDRALEKLKALTEPQCQVIRNNNVIAIPAADLVVSDYLVVEEGNFIAADGIIVRSNDFSINESLLTGESLAVFKSCSSTANTVFQGTTVASGSGVIKVTHIGNDTRLSGIRKSLEAIKEGKTPLELQINSFVKKMVIIGAVVFLIVWAFNYAASHSLSDSLLKALTLAMSILPEEIPVAFATFMALGAWRLAQSGIIAKQVKTVETLGSANIICLDKTGTITENKMVLSKLVLPEDGSICDVEKELAPEALELITMAMWASEPNPFDPMERAIHEAYAQAALVDVRTEYQMASEYPLSGTPPMMTHVFQNKTGKRIIAAKGAPEALIGIAGLSEEAKTGYEATLHSLSAKGYRLLAVGEAIDPGKNLPEIQQDFKFRLKGFLAFYDPPKQNIKQVFEQFYSAGITLKLVTGDNAGTSAAIARQVGLKGWEKAISGQEVMALSDQELQQKALRFNLFTRMYPEAKLRLVNALKASKQVVAMTGDGVNDAPALKAAHIGIAMGKKGTETAKEAASLVLLHDDIAQLLDAIQTGRRIYSNLKKAIRYIISIHIPIMLIVFVPLVLGWAYPNIFLPAHVIFLELIMGPTCSIIFENEPPEANSMTDNPRPYSATIFNTSELATSIVQGIMIAAGVIAVYQYGVQQFLSESLVRTMVFITIISANIMLTLVNRSFYQSIFSTLKVWNNLLPLMIGATVSVTTILLYAPPFTRLFNLTVPDLNQLLISVAMGFTSVVWFEVVKWMKRRGTAQRQPNLVPANLPA